MLVLGGFSVLALSGLALWTYLYFRDLTIEQVTGRQRNLLGEFIAEFDSEIATAQHNLLDLAPVFRHQRADLADSGSFQEILARHSGFLHFFHNGLVLLTPDGKMLAQLPSAVGAPEIDFAASDAFRRTLTENRPVISSPFLTAGEQKLALTLTAPVWSADGRLVAVLCGSIDPAWIDYSAHARRHGCALSGSRFYFLDPQGKLLYPADAAAPAGAAVWVREAAASGTGQVSVSILAQEIVTAGRLPSTGWIVAITDPADSALAPVRHFRNLYAIVIAGILVLGTFLAHLLVRGLTGNLERFAAHLERLPQLPPEQRPFVSMARDETQLVAVSFNHLLQELEGERNALLSAKERAESANEMKGRFVSTVSHELRTPLHGIIGLTQLCLESDLSEEQRGQLEGILASGKNLLRLINDLLVIQKVETGGLTLEKSGFSLRHLLNSTAAGFLPRIREKGLELSLDVPLTVPDLLTGDPSRLRLVLGNFLDNACKFSLRGTITLGVVPVAERSEEVDLRFFVRDEGCGIPADCLERIFHRFEQGEQTNTRNFGGIGLGLAINRQILTLMGSSIDIASTLEEGSTFSFVLTFARQILPRVNEPAPSTPQGRTALIVSSSSACAGELENYLRRLRMLPLRTVPEQLEQCVAGEKIDLILLDCSSGESEPWEMVRQIRRCCGGGFLVLIPRFGLFGDAELCAANGVDGYLRRPFGEKEFAAFIYHLFGCRSPGGSRTGRAPVTLYEVEESRYRLTVLVVEDIEINRKIISSILLRHGHRVLQAENGRQGVESWREHAIDLVFMDVQMPEMDGLEATRLIRAEESAAGRRRTPIVAVTAGVLPQEKEACLAAGMDGYLLKPFDLGELRSLLVQTVEARLREEDCSASKEKGL